MINLICNCGCPVFKLYLADSMLNTVCEGCGEISAVVIMQQKFNPKPKKLQQDVLFKEDA